MTDEPVAEVIQLFPTTDEREIIRESGPYCRHLRIGYCLQTRSLSCRDCGAALDPFDTFVATVREWVSWKEWAAEHKRKAGLAKAELDDLKRQIKNAKASLRRVSR